jgi:Flp pilus assembly protein TadD
MMRKLTGILILLALTLCGAQGALAEQRPAPRQREGVGHPQGARLQSLLEKAERALAGSDFRGAAAALEEFISIEPENAYVRFQLGYAYTGLERPEDAAREYRRAAEIDPEMAEAHLNLGLVLLDRDPEAAVPAFERAADLLPGKARPHFLLGLARERSGRPAEAVEAYRRAVALDADDFEFHFALARTLLALERFEEAEADFRKSLEIRPGMPAATLGLAESLVGQKKFDAAAEALAAYLESAPEDSESRVQLASLLLDLGREEDALVQMDRAQQAGFESVALLKMRTDAHLRRGELEAAIKSLARAVELQPGDHALRARLGRLWLERRDFAAAERELLAALNADPSLTDALRDLVSTFYLAEKYPQALRAIDLLQQREELPPGSWFIRATCYDKLGQKAEALAAYEKFLSLDDGRSDTQSFQARHRARLLARELRRR